MKCPECGGVVRVSLADYYCTECNASWEHLTA